MSGKGTVTVKGAAKKTSKSIKVPDTVTIRGVKYRVTAIGTSAFKGCKKLKTITIKATALKKIGKNAFKGIYAKAKITVPKKKLSKYKKMLKPAQGVKKTMKVKGK